MLVILKAFKQCMMKNQFIHIRHTCVYYFLMCIGWFNRYEVIGILLLIYSCLSIIRYYTKYAIAGFLQKKDIAGWCYIIDGWLIVSIALSIYDKDFTWLSRFGSIATFAGVWLSYRSLSQRGFLPGFGDNLYIAEYVGSKITAEGNFIETKLTKNSLEKKEQNKLDQIATICGLSFIIVGTIIWGYADLLNKLIGWK